MMKSLIAGLVGFAAGWAVRAVFDSGRDALVAITAAGYGMADRARRLAGFEREYFEDMLAEGKARWETARRRRAAEAEARVAEADSGAERSEP